MTLTASLCDDGDETRTDGRDDDEREDRYARGPTGVAPRIRYRRDGRGFPARLRRNELRDLQVGHRRAVGRESDEESARRRVRVWVVPATIPTRLGVAKVLYENGAKIA